MISTILEYTIKIGKTIKDGGENISTEKNVMIPQISQIHLIEINKVFFRVQLTYKSLLSQTRVN